MKLWLLKPYTNSSVFDDLWTWDCAFGFVVRAGTPKKARLLASKRHGDEESGPWLNPKLVKCSQLKPSGKESVILMDFNAG